MKLFELCDPRKPAVFAQFAHVGTWSDGFVCECGFTTQELIPPLLIEWEAGAEKIGDFAWCSFEFVVKENVRKFLSVNSYECGFEAVKVLPPKSRASAGRKVPRVPFPYTGPQLFWVRPKERVAVIENISGVKRLGKCQKCGNERYRWENNQIFIKTSELIGKKCFKLGPGRMPITCLTEAAAEDLEKQGFDGYKLVEIGSVVGEKRV